MGERDERRSASSTTAIAVVVLLLFFGAYVGGYFRLGTKTSVKSGEPVPVVVGVVRLYPRKWQVTAFQPAAYVESVCIGVKVYLGDFATYGDPNAEEP
jgi:hypothetical protein